MSEPARFDPVVHAPNRLQICAILAAVEDADFATVRDALNVSDSVLSKHLRVLEESGYVVLRKRAAGGRLRTRTALTTAGRRAFAGHVAELQRLAAGLPVDLVV